MISTGNDIVALHATQPEKTNLPRFYSRILTIDEKKLYDQLPLAFDSFVWLCWSIKESAYKFTRRNIPDLVFAPLKITIPGLLPPSPDNAGLLPPSNAAGEGYFRGKVCCSGSVLYSRSLLRDGIVVTVVSDDERFTNTHWGFQPIASSAYADQSASVRAFALKHLSAALSRDDLQVQKDQDGCPIVVAGQQQLNIPLSLAHHDRYVAWSFTYSRVAGYSTL